MPEQTEIQCYLGPCDGKMLTSRHVDIEAPPMFMKFRIESEPDETCDVSVFLSEATYRLAKILGRLIYCYVPPKV